jgi:3-oxoacyl-[acyl-carrier protein] reductase
MSDRYQRFANSGIGKRVARGVGLPTPVPLERYEPGQPVARGPVLLGAAHGGRLAEPARDVLRSVGAQVLSEPDGSRADGGGLGAIVFDASGIDESRRLRALYDFLHPAVRELRPSGRLIILATPPAECVSAAAAAAQRAIEGFTRSMAKEVGKGATGQLVQVAPGGEVAIESTLRFLLSGRSAYVSGQVVRIGGPVALDGPAPPDDWERPLAGRVAAVTGASRGIGAAIASVLVRDGAEVVCIDVPAQGEALTEVANRIGATSLQLDITGADAPQTLARQMEERHGGLDLIVHNAGITRDKTLGRMEEAQWDAVLEVNLSAPERLNAALLEGDVLRAGGSIVAVSSVSGIAGNRGQSNYATSKAGLIGMVDALAPEMVRRGGAINAVAPGFIETQMTAAMPLGTREAGRRLNSLAQGGQPVDVAETIAWLGAPASAGVNGNVIRVCGQQLLGA